MALAAILDEGIKHAIKARACAAEFDYEGAAYAFHAASMSLKEALDSNLITDDAQKKLIRSKYDKFKQQEKIYTKKVNKTGMSALERRINKLKGGSKLNSKPKSRATGKTAAVGKKQDKLRIMQERLQKLVEGHKLKLEKLSEKHGKPLKKKHNEASRVSEPDAGVLDLQSRLARLRTENKDVVKGEIKEQTIEESMLEELEEQFSEDIDNKVNTAINEARKEDRLNEDKKKKTRNKNTNTADSNEASSDEVEEELPEIDFESFMKELESLEKQNEKFAKDGKVNSDFEKQAMKLMKQLDKFAPSNDGNEETDALVTEVADTGRALGYNIDKDIHKKKRVAPNKEVMDLINLARDNVNYVDHTPGYKVKENKVSGKVPEMLPDDFVQSDSSLYGSEHSYDTADHLRHKRERRRKKKNKKNASRNLYRKDI